MKNNFSKDDTLVIKGVAIICLIFYHCLSSKSRLMGYSVDFAPMLEYDAYAIFSGMNVCVGMFAFLSSFGLMRTVGKKYLKNKNDLLDAAASSSFIVQRSISLIGAFFIPYIICTLVTLIGFQHNPYGEEVAFVMNMLSDMFGLAGLLGTPMMVMTWWYMSFALVIIVFMPMTVNLYRKYGIGVLAPYLIFPLFIDPTFYNGTSLNNMTRWLLTIPLGIICADSNIFEKLKEMSITKNKVISELLKFIISTGLMVLAFWIKSEGWSWKYFYYIMSSLLPVVFTYWLYAYVCGIPVLKNILAFLGRYSSDIFFMHTFVRVIWLPWLTYSFGTWYGVFLFMLGVSLAMAVIVDLLRKLIHWNDFVAFLNKQSEKLVKSILA